MQFKTGDEITIARGTHRKQTAIVLEANEGQYAVKLGDGTLAVINAVNVREPAEATISASALAEVLNAYAGDLPESLFADLDARVPGITDRVRIAEVDVPR